MDTGSLGLLIDDPGPCPVCDEDECTHTFYGDGHYRIGDDLAEKHPLISRRHIPAPHHIYSPAGQLIFAKGDLMAAEEAAQHGVTIPGQAGPGRPKGKRQKRTETQGPQGPTEDRAHRPDENRKAGADDPHADLLRPHNG